MNIPEEARRTDEEINALNDEIEASAEFQKLPDGQVTLYVAKRHCQAQLLKAIPIIEKWAREELLKYLDDEGLLAHTATYHDGAFRCGEDCQACKLLKEGK